MVSIKKVSVGFVNEDDRLEGWELYTETGSVFISAEELSDAVDALLSVRIAVLDKKLNGRKNGECVHDGGARGRSGATRGGGRG
jgi:hypothetical protein